MRRALKDTLLVFGAVFGLIAAVGLALAVVVVPATWLEERNQALAAGWVVLCAFGLVFALMLVTDDEEAP